MVTKKQTAVPITKIFI